MLFFRRTAQLVRKAAGYLLLARTPSIWGGGHLRPDVRAHLLTLARDFIATVQPDDAQLRDLILTGSLASGDVLPDSDCDLHLVMDFSSAPAPETARDFLHDHAALWNEHHHVTILGHPVELYVQDIREPHYAAATYSVQDDRWLMVAAQPADAVSVEEIAEHATDVRGRIDAIAANVEAGNDAGAVLDATGLCSELRDMRRHGLATEGPFGLANRVFKALRHAGDLARLQQLARRAYDAKLSIVKAHVGGDADRPLTIEDLATRKAEIEKRLVYLDDEDLPALEGRDDAPAVLAKSQLVMQRARLLGELLAIDYRLGPLLKSVSRGPASARGACLHLQAGAAPAAPRSTSKPMAPRVRRTPSAATAAMPATRGVVVVDFARCRLVLKAGGAPDARPERADTRPATGRLRFAPPSVRHPPGISPAKPAPKAPAQKPLPHTAVPHADLAGHLATLFPALHAAVEKLVEAFQGMPIAGRLAETATLVSGVAMRTKGTPVEAQDLAVIRLRLGGEQEREPATARVRRLFGVTEDGRGSDVQTYGTQLTIRHQGQPIEVRLVTAEQIQAIDEARMQGHASAPRDKDVRLRGAR